MEKRTVDRSKWNIHPIWISIVAATCLGSIATYMVLHPSSRTQTLPTAKVTYNNIGASLAITGQVDTNNTVFVAVPVSGTISDLAVESGDQVQAGQVLGHLSGYTLAQQTYDDLKQSMAAAISQEQLAQQKLSLDEGQSASESIVNQDQSAVNTAQAQLTGAEALVDDELHALKAISQPSASQVASAKSQLDKATGDVASSQLVLSQAQQQLQADKSGGNSASVIRQEENIVASDEQQLTIAQKLQQDEQEYYNAVTSNDPTQIDQAKSSLTQAEGTVAVDKAQLAQAQSKLQGDKSGEGKVALLADKQALTNAQQNAAEAKINVDKAKDSVSQNELIAPVGGLVVSVSKQVGDLVSPDETVFEILPNVSRREVVGVVSPADVASIKAGDRVTVTSDTISGSWTGTVRFVSPEPIVEQNTNLMQYKVYVNITTSTLPGSAKPGMPLTLTIETHEVHHVTVVPTSAVMVHNGQTGVFVQAGPNNYTFKQVDIGASDNHFVQTTGLKLGTVVALKEPTNS